MNAPLSIWTGYYWLHPDNSKEPEDAVREFLKDGIYCSECAGEHATCLLSRGGDNYIEEGKRFKRFLDENGYTMTQGHIDWPFEYVGDDKADNIERIIRNIKLYEAMGIKCAVLHCDRVLGLDASVEEKIELNILGLKKLSEGIKGVDITICLENLTSFVTDADTLLYIIEKVGDPKFAICLDTGHLNYTKASSQREFILKAGKKLRALHIADNDGSDDQHLMPFGKGKVNFEEVVKALDEIGYEGLFNYEIPGENGKYTPLEMRHEKMKFIKKGYEYLMTSIGRNKL